MEIFIAFWAGMIFMASFIFIMNKLIAKRG